MSVQLFFHLSYNDPTVKNRNNEMLTYVDESAWTNKGETAIMVCDAACLTELHHHKL